MKPCLMTPSFRFAALLAMVIFSGLLHAGNENQKGSSSSREDYPQWFVQANLDLKTLLDSSLASGRKGLMVVFSLPRCRHCDHFTIQTLRDLEIGEKLRANFVSVHLDLSANEKMVTPDGRQMTIKQFGKQQRVFGTPATYFYGDQGKRLARKIGFQTKKQFAQVIKFVTEQHYLTTSLGSYLLPEEQRQETHDQSADEPTATPIPFVPDPCAGCGDAAQYL